MDGNGRWARARNMPRFLGHRQGAKALEEILNAAQDAGVKYLTVYAFSVDNWKRSAREVRALLKLLEYYVDTKAAFFKKHNMRLGIIGDTDVLAKALRDKINKTLVRTKTCDGMTFSIAFNYGARPEIVRAAQMLCRECLKKKMRPADIDEKTFARFLYTRALPDPDLIIRTGGEQRLSNFLLWQASYAELYFTDTLWPDFNKKELEKALLAYSRRQRRFGGL